MNFSTIQEFQESYNNVSNNVSFVIKPENFKLIPLRGNEGLFNLVMMFDVDSVYGVSHSLLELVQALGQNTRYQVPSTTNRINSSNGSRIKIDCRLLKEHPIMAGTKVVKNINLESIPNNSVFRCTIDGLNGVVVNIGLYLVGIKSLRKTNYFQNVELGVLNAMLNLSKKIVLRQSDLDLSVRNEFHRLSPVVNKTPGDQSYSFFCGGTSYLSHKAMLVFAVAMEAALMSLIDDDTGTYFTPSLLGFMDVSTPNKIPFTQEQFLDTAIFIQKNKLWHWSGAGFKSHFHSLPEVPTIRIEEGKIHGTEHAVDSDYFWNLVNSKTNELFDIVKNIFVCEDRPLNYLYEFDIGIDFVPTQEDLAYLVNGKKMKEQLVEMLRYVLPM